MVRTKKQIIDSLAIKNNNKQEEDTRLDHSTTITVEGNTRTMTSEFYAPNVPTSPLPTLMMMNQKESNVFPDQHTATMSTIPAIKSMSYFEPPYVMNNFWPPPQQQQKMLYQPGVDGKKIQATFSNLSPQEVHEMLMDCGGNEDEAILRLITQTGYLEYIRHRIPTVKHSNAAPPPCQIVQQQPSLSGTRLHQQQLPVSSTQFQQRQQQPLSGIQLQQQQPVSSIQLQPVSSIQLQPVSSIQLQQQAIQPKPSVIDSTPIRTSINSTPSPHNETVVDTENVQSSTAQHKTHKKHSRSSKSNYNSGGCRLALDDALQQVQESEKNGGDTDGYAGWSAARLRAFKMIDKNPNSYYYRFNAPGEQQKKGKWTEEETALFLNRLKQVGANSQWGIFSIAIPGRVGYQCSNYYRFMIEMGQLHDPNYVLDEKGKARYLFDKKTEDGAVEKIFRKHSKHGSVSANDPHSLKESPPTRKRKSSTTSSRQYREDSDDDDDDPTFSIKKSTNKKKTPKKNTLASNNNRRVTRQSLQHHEEEDNDEEYQTDHVVPN